MCGGGRGCDGGGGGGGVVLVLLVLLLLLLRKLRYKRIAAVRVLLSVELA